jgi:hypothetical protein
MNSLSFLKFHFVFSRLVVRHELDFYSNNQKREKSWWPPWIDCNLIYSQWKDWFLHLMCEVHFPLFWLGVARSEFLSSLSSDFVVPSLIPRGQWGPSSSCSRPKREAARLALFSVFPGRFYFLLRPFAGLPPVSKCCLLLTSKACGLIWFVFFLFDFLHARPDFVSCGDLSLTQLDIGPWRRVLVFRACCFSSVRAQRPVVHCSSDFLLAVFGPALIFRF